MDKNIQSQGEQKKQNMLQKMLGKFSLGKLSAVMALASLMSLSAFAADGETTTVTIGSLLTDAGTTIPQLASLAWNVITSNPLTTACVLVMLASLGFALLRRARRVVH